MNAMLTPNAGKLNLPRNVRKSALAAFGVCASSFGISQGFAAGDDGPRRGAMEEVVVTAQKREERLQDVPISVSVLDGGKLDRFTGEGVTEALASVPGIKLTEDLWNGTQVALRGVAASGPVLAGSSPVAYYIDSLPFGFVRNSVGPDTSAYDLSRVEVLRGPQGTLYDASALNGVVRVLTNAASLDEFELKARTSLSSIEGGSESYRGDLAINVPLVEGKLAARSVVGYAKNGGWIDRMDKEDVNDAELSNVRLKVNARPTEKLALGLSLWRSRADRDSPTLGTEDDEFPGTIGDTPTSSDYDILGFTFGYEFTGFSVSSATSYIDYSNKAVFDLSPLGLNDPLLTFVDSKVFAEELLISSSSDGLWRWSAGAFYRDAEDNWSQVHPIFFNPFSDFTDNSESFAVFGELTRSFLDGRVELTGGLRYFEDEVLQVGNGGVTGFGRERFKFENLSPRVVLNWHPTDRLTAYVSYAQGFRSGVGQAPGTEALVPGVDLPPAKEDKLNNYEVGVKGSVMEGRIDFDAAAYYVDWQDAQQQIDINLPGTAVGALVGIANGESASGPGFDVALVARPANGLELGASFSWNDLTMDAPVYSGGAILLDKGDRLRLSAEYTIGTSAAYVFPLGGTGLSGQVSAAANYGSKLFSPRSLTAAGTSTQLPAGDHTLDSRASMSILSPNHWTADLFVDNVTNYRGTFSGSAVSYYSARPRPRTIGVQFEYRYE